MSERSDWQNAPVWGCLNGCLGPVYAIVIAFLLYVLIVVFGAIAQEPAGACIRYGTMGNCEQLDPAIEARTAQRLGDSFKWIDNLINGGLCSIDTGKHGAGREVNAECRSGGAP